MKIQIDRVVLRAMLACAVAAVVMLANRWVVASQQADVLAAVLVANSRMSAAHTLADHLEHASNGLDAANTSSHVVALSEHHLAAVLVSARGESVGQARPAAQPYFQQSLTAAYRSLDGAYFDAAGRPEQAHAWRLLPAATAVELDAGNGQRLRVLVSLQLARDNQLYIFVQGVKSVALALAVVLAAVLLILRTPRRSLVEASRYAGQLPYQPALPLRREDAGLAAINTLRDSLNTVGDLLEQQRLRHRVDQQRLQQAAVKAQDAAHAKSTFLAHMSHEVRTPLNGVLGLTQLVLNGELSAIQRQHLQTAHQAAANLLQVVNEVLDLSKMDAGKLRLDAVPFSLYALLDEACKPFALPAADKSIELINEVCPNLPISAIGDPMRLRQVLINLIGNAVKFTDSGHVRLHVVAAAPLATWTAADSVPISFCVSDTGPGIAEDKKALILEAFVQADPSIERRFGGTGLGLTIAAQLLELMGSTLKVESRVGQGSSFSFELRLGLPRRPAGQGHAARYQHLPGEQVLWVDASSNAVPWYRHVFELWSMGMDHAGELNEAIHKLGSARFSALFIDPSVLRGASDAQVQALLHAAGGARVCAKIGPTEELHPLLAAQGGAVHLLMKPLSPMDLNRALCGPTRTALPDASRLDGLKLLVAEDNEVNQLVAAATLEALGAQVVIAVDGMDALRRIGLGRFDAVLMDLQMPRMGGLEATRRLREQERAAASARLPVIAMTAFDHADEAVPMQAAGMDGYVSKPFNTEQLVRELHAVIARGALIETLSPIGAAEPAMPAAVSSTL